MRIVGGDLRGRTLCDFSKIGIRPTSDMARESLFNILRDKIVGANFLDVFSGTGAIGIEALSRGAKKVVLNDSSSNSINLIKKNLSKLNIENKIILSRADYRACLSRANDKFDIIYIDPPYDAGLNEDAVLCAINVLSDGGVIILESEKEFDGEILGLEIFDRRKYGKAKLTFFRKSSKACVFAGEFDPITVGHEYIIRECLKSFDKVLVVLGDNPDKTPYFTLSEREKLLTETFFNEDKIKIINYVKNSDKFLDILKEEDAKVYVRGIRNEQDLIYEKINQEKNALIYPEIKTVYLNANEKYKEISSSLIKEKIKTGENVEKFIPEKARECFNSIIKSKKI